MSKKIVISGDGVTYGADIEELTPLLPGGHIQGTDQALDTGGANEISAAHTHLLGGSGTALNVVNPFFVVYIFKRTA